MTSFQDSLLTHIFRASHKSSDLYLQDAVFLFSNRAKCCFSYV
uniref:Uncharacterized protein n=1 Tax=Arundo donax TaxID=35708 RepID=A0A0A8Y8D0_ARUDO